MILGIIIGTVGTTATILGLKIALSVQRDIYTTRAIKIDRRISSCIHRTYGILSFVFDKKNKYLTANDLDDLHKNLKNPRNLWMLHQEIVDLIHIITNHNSFTHKYFSQKHIEMLERASNLIGSMFLQHPIKVIRDYFEPYESGSYSLYYLYHHYTERQTTHLDPSYKCNECEIFEQFLVWDNVIKKETNDRCIVCGVQLEDLKKFVSDMKEGRNQLTELAPDCYKLTVDTSRRLVDYVIWDLAAWFIENRDATSA